MPKDKETKYPTRFRDSEALEIVAKNVRRYRIEKGMSMEDLANLVDVEYTVISRLELQKSNPSISVVYAIGRALGIEPHRLLINIKD